MENIIEFAVCLFFAVMCLVIGITQLNELGVPLNNAYLFVSKEKKQSMNKTPYFKQTGVVFILLAVVFALIAAAYIFRIEWLSYLALGFGAVDVIFAVVSEIIIEGSPKRLFRFKFFGFFRHE